MLIGVDGNEANVSQRVGSNQYAFEILKILHQIGKKHRWLVYLRDKPLEDLPKATRYWHYKVIKPRRFWTQLRLPLDLFLARPRPEIFFTPGHYSPRWCPVPLVISIMDLGYLRCPDQFTKSIYYQLKIWTERSIKKAKEIMAISQATRDDIVRFYQVPSGKITVTYPGLNSEQFNPKISQLRTNRVRKKYKINKDYILFLSTLKPNKNIEGLIEAFAQIKDNLPGTDLVISGKKGWLFEKIFAQVNQLKIKDRVIFTGFVEEKEVAPLLSGAKVFVFPSFWEGFGIPVLEAMACGTPVVASKVGSLPEIVGQAGVLVDPAKPEDISRGILEAIAKTESLSKLGILQSVKFSWYDCGRKTLEVLEKVGKNAI